MRRRTKWLLWIAGPIALLALIWFGVGAYYSAKFEDRLAEMRKAGTIRLWEDLRLPEPEPGTNGWSVLAEADALRAAVDRQYEDDVDGLLLGGPPFWSHVEPWSDEERAAVAPYLERLAPYFERLDAALGFPVVLRPLSQPFTYDSASPLAVIEAVDAWALAARYDRSSAIGNLDRMLRLLDRWQPSDPADVVMFSVWWNMALRLLRDEIAGGADPSAHRAVWDAILLRADDRLAPLFVRSRLIARASQLELVRAWRRGEDPLAAHREERRRIPVASKRREAVSDPPLEDLDPYFTDAFHGDEPPWISRWYGRPYLHVLACGLLEAYERSPVGEPRKLVAATLASVPTQPLENLLVKTQACLRLGRIALAGREVPGFQRVSGSLKDENQGTFRWRIRQKLGIERMLMDPFTNWYFRWEILDDKWVVHIDPDESHHVISPDYLTLKGKELLERMRKDVLLWSMPLPD